MFVRVNQDLAVDPALVESLRWDNRFYMNGSVSVLEIIMQSGKVHRVEHGAGFNAYRVEKMILDEKERLSDISKQQSEPESSAVPGGPSRPGE